MRIETLSGNRSLSSSAAASAEIGVAASDIVTNSGCLVVGAFGSSFCNLVLAFDAEGLGTQHYI